LTVKKIILTGGGSAGHVTPNLALIPALRGAGFDIEYVGAANGIEKELAEAAGLKFHAISAGKLRRYISAKNITDIRNVIKGIRQSLRIIKKLKPDAIFSKGGFVAVPVVVAARMRGVPVILHESDVSPGLANRISIPLAARVCASFPETIAALPKKKSTLTGLPLREELFRGSRAAGLNFLGFDGAKPVLLIIGGSLGSARLNGAVRETLSELLKTFDAAHICGRNNVDPAIRRLGYAQFEYLNKELPDALAAADIVVSRAGANAVFELIALRKPALLVPLSKRQSRGDQIENAASFTRRGFGLSLADNETTAAALPAIVGELYARRAEFAAEMSKSGQTDAQANILSVICQIAQN
jgi:UDP-N-acetylglucosamine--N-acetylmuramyl-(pentapeptide) pyrophosphoryl-undecaprenol N-acetylglucosamine transferase